MTAPEEPTTATVPPSGHDHPHGHLAGDVHGGRPNRLYQVAAWVAIVAGVVFIVGAVFLTGFTLGRHSGNDGWGHHSRFDRMDRGGPGMMGPGMMGPGMMPTMDQDERPGMRPPAGPPPRP